MDTDLRKNLDGVLSGEVKENRDITAPGTSELRMWLFVRKDLAMTVGKFAPQVGHAYATCLYATMVENRQRADEYMSYAQGKISVGVDNEAQLIKVVQSCKEKGLIACTVTDAGRTFFNGPTMTVGAVGPCYREDLPRIARQLRLFEDWSAEERAKAGVERP